MGLATRNGAPFPSFLVNRFIKASPELESITIMGNRRLPVRQQGGDCWLVPACAKAESRPVPLACSFDLNVCGVDRVTAAPAAPPVVTPFPTRAPTTPTPTQAPVTRADLWTALYDALDGSNWSDGSGAFRDFFCTDNPSGRLRRASARLLQCANGNMATFTMRSNRLVGSPAPDAVLKPLMQTDDFVSVDVSSNNGLSWDGCLDNDFDLVAPYGSVAASSVTGVTVCSAPSPLDSEAEAFAELFDQLGGEAWVFCSGKRDAHGNCKRFSFSADGSITRVRFDVDMGFADATDGPFQLTRFARALPALTSLDISGQPFCLNAEHQALVGCGAAVACTLHESCTT